MHGFENTLCFTRHAAPVLRAGLYFAVQCCSGFPYPARLVQKCTSQSDQIGIATREQSQGLGQINEAVSHLDRMTQQNAALVEQSAASASAMNTDAGVLGRTLSIFKM